MKVRGSIPLAGGADLFEAISEPAEGAGPVEAIPDLSLFPATEA